MPRIKEAPMGWEECGDLVKGEIRKLQKAVSEGAKPALDDTYPIRSLFSTFNGYGPRLPIRIEDMHGVPEQFRLAVCLEHSISLVVSDLIQLYYKDRDLVYRLDEEAVDIKAARGILGTLKTFINCYEHQFVEHGNKYAAVRRSCDEFYHAWFNQRSKRPKPVRELDLEQVIMEMGVVRDMALQLSLIRAMIQTGNMSPGV